MKEAIDLLRAVAALLWPALALVLFFTYKEDLRALLRRIRKGKLLGQEIELDASLRELQEEASKAASQVKDIPTTHSEMRIGSGDGPEQFNKIIEESVQSPKVALLLLGAEIEKELRHVLLGSGWHGGQEIRGLSQGFDVVNRLEVLPKHVAGSVRLFSEMRNRLIHGGSASDDDVLRAIDSGLTILKALRSIPLELHVVHHPGVDLYSDAEGRDVMPGVKGVILESTSPGGATKRHAIFPTTRGHFKSGQRVAWEWDLKNKYGPSWYRDPDTAEVKQAFLGSMEFTGRDLNGA